MPTVDSIDVYIERSLRLFEANPSTTRVTITYGSAEKKAKKSGKQPKTSVANPPATHYTTFKTFDPVSGTCFTTSTSKAKELSRLLALLGPRGMQLTKTKKTVDRDGETKKVLSEVVSIKERGIAAILTNREFADEEPEVAQAVNVATETAPAEASKPKKGKKKGKKR
ncbi:unnamed protein product [Kuraishia capsulata CBS 1993]|uniref:SRP9 domain-containing protein n=1 Tax=Kuraishia capsulata CBS 1993 TaxID=1382522 RepID=W6MKQ3_9ASCO|nr:uncharacterized protein KUCA_T00001301001 [Kuraishia capsulata CBS 1993]CDK25332.1 unnamed protein product [Kuraishia capsulata CBS 1993]